GFEKTADAVNLAGSVYGQESTGVGHVLPLPHDPRHARLPAELALGADLARDARHLGREGAELVDHGVDRVLQLEDLALHVDGDLLGEVAVGDRGGHRGDVPNLGGQVARHEVHLVGQVLPRAGHALHVRLPAELPLGASPAERPLRLRREGAQLVHHRVDGVLELQDLAAHVDGDLLGEVAGGDRFGHVRDVAHLAGQIARHEVHAVGQVLPGAGNALHVRLPAELPLRADFACHARHLGGERAELVHHRVDRVLELEEIGLALCSDLLREVTVRDRLGQIGDVPHLRSQVAGHEVDAVGQVLPGAGDALHVRLAAELPLRADFACDARHLGGEGAELVHHRVDRVLELQDLAAHVDGDLLGEVTVRDRGRHVRDVPHLPGQVPGHQVHAVGQ